MPANYKIVLSNPQGIQSHIAGQLKSVPKITFENKHSEKCKNVKDIYFYLQEFGDSARARKLYADDSDDDDDDEELEPNPKLAAGSTFYQFSYIHSCLTICHLVIYHQSFIYLSKGEGKNYSKHSSGINKH